LNATKANGDRVHGGVQEGTSLQGILLILAAHACETVRVVLEEHLGTYSVHLAEHRKSTKDIHSMLSAMEWLAHSQILEELTA
jgi:hypothetical protein